jgi:hypothetical protein
MIPGFYLTRLNQRYQEESMTCDKPCANCKCKKPCDTLPSDADLYNEIDDGTFAPPSQYNPLKEIN